jgi:uncharacterized protein (TIGR03437 family)
MTPIKVGQLPRSIALMPDGNTMYVANSGGESISIVDLELGQTVGRVRFPPIPFNTASPLITPSVIAPTIRGPLIIMNNGTLWKVVGDEAVPRAVSTAIGSSVIAAPRNMVATPNGESVLLMAGNGFVYLYDASLDEFVVGRQIFTNPIQGYYGPVSAGPRGQYFLVNGTVLNQSLTPTTSAGSIVQAGGRPGTTTPVPRPVSQVAAVSNTMFARYVQPVRLQANNPLTTEPPLVELVDVNTGNVMRQAMGIEGPISTQTGTQRVNVSGRTMAVDASGTTAYVLTTSGLSMIPLEPITAAERPVMTQPGVVNYASQLPAIAQGGLVSIYGRNLAAEASAPDPPQPTVLGGVCVTLNNRPLPLLATSPGQINAQIPPDLAAGRYPLVIRNVDRRVSSVAAQATVARYAPAVIVNPQTKAAVYFEDGKPVTRDRKASRDDRLVLFAVGLGPTTGGRVVAGEGAPKEPPAVVNNLEAFFGDVRYSQAPIAVEWAGLVPGLVGVYQVNLYVPWNHLKGDALLVTLKVGGVSSPSTGNNVPTVAVD